LGKRTHLEQKARDVGYSEQGEKPFIASAWLHRKSSRTVTLNCFYFMAGPVNKGQWEDGKMGRWGSEQKVWGVSQFSNFVFGIIRKGLLLSGWSNREPVP
jgi:hypothetical protein